VFSETSTPTFSTASGSLSARSSNIYDSLSLRGELDDYHGEFGLLISNIGLLKNNKIILDSLQTFTHEKLILMAVTEIPTYVFFYL
jgi:hypothetical protein